MTVYHHNIIVLNTQSILIKDTKLYVKILIHYTLQHTSPYCITITLHVPFENVDRRKDIRYARMHTKSAHVVLLCLCCACERGKVQYIRVAKRWVRLNVCHRIEVFITLNLLNAIQ